MSGKTAESPNVPRTAERKSIPVLRGWTSLPKAGSLLGVSRQRLFQMVDEGKWTTIHQIPGKPSDDPNDEKRPALLVVADWEVDKLLAAQRASARPETPEPEALAS